MILDGWGIGKHDKTDAIFSTPTPFISALTEKYPHSTLLTCGENVGLPDGQMGNSEVGHLNIGAGRVVNQDLVRINKACRDNSIMQNPEIVKAFTYARDNNKQVHFMGLVSDGGVHSSLEHLKKLCDVSKEYGIQKTFVHCFMDGRDTDPKSGLGFIQELKEHMDKSTGRIASVVGRYYAMDRDNRWERIKEAYELIVNGVGTPTQHVETSIRQSYEEGVTDEFIKPIVHVGSDGKPVGVIEPGDMVIFFNYRNDRAKELTIALTQRDMLHAYIGLGVEVELCKNHGCGTFLEVACHSLVHVAACGKFLYGLQKQLFSLIKSFLCSRSGKQGRVIAFIDGKTAHPVETEHVEVAHKSVHLAAVGFAILVGEAKRFIVDSLEVGKHVKATCHALQGFFPYR